MRDVTATTRVFALLGDPVAHSLSPRMQNAAFRHAGVDAVYVALRCESDDVAPLVRALARAGGGGNVTVPHKAAAAACVERATSVVLRTGACNTFWGEAGTLCGDNTDVAAIASAAAQLIGDVRGSSCLVLGAGGAAAAAVCALLDAGAAQVLLLNRSPARAHALAARLDPEQRRARVVDDVASLRHASFGLVVNATSLGLHPDDPLPLDLAATARASAALDLIYRGAGATTWVQHVQQLGMPAADGRDVLVAQGAAAFAHWFGAQPDVQVMRAAVAPAREPA